MPPPPSCSIAVVVAFHFAIKQHTTHTPRVVFVTQLYTVIVYSNTISRNAIVKIVALGEAECNYSINHSSRNPIPILKNVVMERFVWVICIAECN